mgnify:CR=1 FL=1
MNPPQRASDQVTRIRLGVNIDHIATLRQARGGSEPDPLTAALLAQKAGADQITIHLREDRRHIQDDDVIRIREAITIPLNLEMAAVDEVVQIALRVRPDKVTLVPERREEITTEGGLDVAGQLSHIAGVCQTFKSAKMDVSLFIEPDRRQILAASQSGAPSIEIHTGKYAASTGADVDVELRRIRDAVDYAQSLGLRVQAGHGLTADNLKPLLKIEGIEEFNIGHSIIARATLLGLEESIHQIIHAAGER